LQGTCRLARMTSRKQMPEGHIVMRRLQVNARRTQVVDIAQGLTQHAGAAHGAAQRSQEARGSGGR
jgi:hypothetical protein